MTKSEAYKTEADLTNEHRKVYFPDADKTDYECPKFIRFLLDNQELIKQFYEATKVLYPSHQSVSNNWTKIKHEE